MREVRECVSARMVVCVWGGGGGGGVGKGVGGRLQTKRRH